MVEKGNVFSEEPSTIPDYSFESYVKAYTPRASASDVKYIADTLYPPAGQNTPYTNETGRVQLFAGDLLIYSKKSALNTAFDNKTHVYEFAVPPGLHIQDLQYTFYNGPAPPVNETVAIALQNYVISFALTGNTGPAGLPEIPAYKHAQVLKLTANGFEQDVSATERTAFLARATFA